MSLKFMNNAFNTSLIIRAAGYAKAAHEGQFRNNLLAGTSVKVPYIVHVARVAGSVCVLPDVTEEMIAAAWLHDVIEDCDVKYETLVYLFGKTVADYTMGLTSYSKRPGVGLIEDRETRIRLNNEYTAKEYEAVRRIKICDRIDNMTDTLIEATQEFALRYVWETKELMNLAFQSIPDQDLFDRLLGLVIAVEEKYQK
jgi:(p)ppGpp synthase/HD superfamily hydrolase